MINPKTKERCSHQHFFGILTYVIGKFHLVTGLTLIQVTYEIQPPSYTSLKVLTGPPIGGGGDTVWSSNYAAYGT